MPHELKTRTDVINAMITMYSLVSYLEVGVRNPKDNYDRVNAPVKEGVDIKDLGVPGIHGHGSDLFFSETNSKFDLIFIDGAHDYAQVWRDLDNSLHHLHRGGLVIMHDSLPRSERYKEIERCGDVWKVVEEALKRPDLVGCTIPVDHGVTIIRKKGER